MGAEQKERDHRRRSEQHSVASQIPPARVAEHVQAQQGLQHVTERSVDEEQVAPREASGRSELRRAELLAFVEAVHGVECPREHREKEEEQNRRDDKQEDAALDPPRNRARAKCTDDECEQGGRDERAEPPRKKRVVMHGPVRTDRDSRP